MPSYSTTLLLCASDHEQLRLRLELASPLLMRTPKAFADLRAELNRAVIVPDAELPANIARIGSHVRVVDLETGDVETFTLTLPEQADPAAGRLSVLAPLGLAILGQAAGDTFAWIMPSGRRQYRLLESTPVAVINRQPVATA